MKKVLWVVVCLLVVITLVVGGCTSKAIKPLSEDEKETMVQIALAHPDVSKWLETGDVYSTEAGWVVIAWEGSQVVGWYRVDYEDIKNGKPPSDIAYVTDDVTINPQVYIRVGEPVSLFISVICDRDREEVLAIELQPGRPTAGPTPPE